MLFHPFAEEYPMMSEADLEHLVDGMKNRGYDEAYPIVIYEEKILDGRNRFLAAQKANVPPTFSDFTGTEEDAKAKVKRANEDRRHLKQEWLTAKRAERIARIAQARTDGKSLRAIAKEEKVSKTQVVNDIDDAVRQGVCPTEPKTVTGTDGKTYQAKKPPKPKIICERCSRLSHPIEGCAACKEAKAAAKKPDTEPKEELEPGPQTMEEVIAAKNSIIESFCRKLMKLVDKECPTDEWLEESNRRNGAIQKIKDACVMLRNAKCHYACPMCGGDRCDKCKQTGRVSKDLYDQLS